MAGVCVPWGSEACRLLFPIRRELPVSFALPKSSSMIMIVNDNLSGFFKSSFSPEICATVSSTIPTETSS
ncbi:unnamed protein product [Eruca vesicaria subsp. sativa]|uniref:Uncharacterized protein n=1 Tax=Eruca vesicaria subsp. sativa TaxID=29727 RepID=A0ABC8LW88_ERUVS|nr:unnamed protein product [Eruca vesicaria subsp. sativa]